MPSTSKSGSSKSRRKLGRLSRWFYDAQVFWHREFRGIKGVCVFVVAVLIVGTLFLVIVDATDYVFSTEKFCGTTCHVMDAYVYKELKESKHWNTPSGVRAKCADCHVHRRLSFAMIDHFLGTGELYVQLTHGNLDKPGAFEELRPAAADRVRFAMIKDDSARCRGCHDMEAIKPKRIRGQNIHADALENGTTCIICHYNLVHKEVEPSEAFSKAIELAIGQELDEEESDLEVEGEDEVL